MNRLSSPSNNALSPATLRVPPEQPGIPSKKKALVLAAKGSASLPLYLREQLNEAAAVDYQVLLEPLTADAFIAQAQPYAFLAITRRAVHCFDRSIIERLPHLKGLSVYSTGLEWLDLDCLQEHKIQLRCLSDYSSNAVAEAALGLGGEPLKPYSGMKRVLILGSGGSGKTTFSRKFAAKTGLPLYHLDSLYWQPGWTAPPEPLWQEKIAGLVRQEAWILDGSYAGTLPLRLPRATHIVFLEIPAWRCLWNILKRRFQYAAFRRKIRPGLPPGCPEKIYFTFLKWVWRYPKVDKPKVMQAIARYKDEKAKVLIFRSYGALERFLDSLAQPPASAGNFL